LGGGRDKTAAEEAASRASVIALASMYVMGCSGCFRDEDSNTAPISIVQTLLRRICVLALRAHAERANERPLLKGDPPSHRTPFHVAF